MIDQGRQLAVRAAVRLDAGVNAEMALDQELQAVGIDHPHRPRATDLFYQTVRWQIRLDHALSRCLNRPLRDLQPEVRAILRVGALELLIEEHPAYAVVDTSVSLAAKLAPAAKGMVNAVLRRVSREGDGPEDEDPVLALAVRHAHPRWLVERWLDRFGERDTVAIMEWDNARPPLWLRVNRNKGTVSAYEDQFQVTGQRHPLVPSALAVSAQPVRKLAGFREGWVSPQGVGSQLVASSLPVAAGWRVADVCAGHGTKALALLERVAKLDLWATDLKPEALRLIGEEARRLGVRAPQTRSMDAAHPPKELHRSFQAVLVDAPCSGLGTLQRHPELRHRCQLDDVRRLAEDQLRILAGSAQLVAAGGVLQYAVCSLESEETTGVVSDFLDHHPDFSEPAAGRWLLPCREGTEGFFIATLTRSEP